MPPTLFSLLLSCFGFGFGFRPQNKIGKDRKHGNSNINSYSYSSGTSTSSPTPSEQAQAQTQTQKRQQKQKNQEQRPGHPIPPPARTTPTTEPTTRTKPVGTKRAPLFSFNVNFEFKVGPFKARASKTKTKPKTGKASSSSSSSSSSSPSSASPPSLPVLPATTPTTQPAKLPPTTNTTTNTIRPVPLRKRQEISPARKHDQPQAQPQAQPQPWNHSQSQDPFLRTLDLHLDLHLHLDLASGALALISGDLWIHHALWPSIYASNYGEYAGGIAGIGRGIVHSHSHAHAHSQPGDRDANRDRNSKTADAEAEAEAEATLREAPITTMSSTKKDLRICPSSGTRSTSTSTSTSGVEPKWKSKDGGKTGHGNGNGNGSGSVSTSASTFTSTSQLQDRQHDGMKKPYNNNNNKAAQKDEDADADSDSDSDAKPEVEVEAEAEIRRDLSAQLQKKKEKDHPDDHTLSRSHLQRRLDLERQHHASTSLTVASRKTARTKVSDGWEAGAGARARTRAGAGEGLESTREAFVDTDLQAPRIQDLETAKHKAEQERDWVVAENRALRERLGVLEKKAEEREYSVQKAHVWEEENGYLRGRLGWYMEQVATLHQSTRVSNEAWEEIVREKRRMEESLQQERERSGMLSADIGRLRHELVLAATAQQAPLRRRNNNKDAAIVRHDENRLRNMQFLLDQQTQESTSLRHQNAHLATELRKAENERNMAVAKRIRDFAWHRANNCNPLVPKPDDVLRARKAEESALESLKKTQEELIARGQEHRTQLRQKDAELAALEDDFLQMFQAYEVLEYAAEKAKACAGRWAEHYANAKRKFGKRQDRCTVNSRLADEGQGLARELRGALEERDEGAVKIRRLEGEVRRLEESEVRLKDIVEETERERDCAVRKGEEAEHTRLIEAEAHEVEIRDLKRKLEFTEARNNRLTVEALEHSYAEESQELQIQLQEKNDMIEYFRDQADEQFSLARYWEFQYDTLKRVTSENLDAAGRWLQERNLFQVQVGAFRDRFRLDLIIEPLIINRRDLRLSTLDEEQLDEIDKSITEIFAATYGGDFRDYREELAPGPVDEALARFRRQYCVGLEDDPLMKIVDRIDQQEREEGGDDFEPPSGSSGEQSPSSSSSYESSETSTGYTTPESEQQLSTPLAENLRSLPPECLNIPKAGPGFSPEAGPPGPSNTPRERIENGTVWAAVSSAPLRLPETHRRDLSQVSSAFANLLENSVPDDEPADTRNAHSVLVGHSQVFPTLGDLVNDSVPTKETVFSAKGSKTSVSDHTVSLGLADLLEDSAPDDGEAGSSGNARIQPVGRPLFVAPIPSKAPKSGNEGHSTLADLLEGSVADRGSLTREIVHQPIGHSRVLTAFLMPIRAASRDIEELTSNDFLTEPFPDLPSMPEAGPSGSPQSEDFMPAWPQGVPLQLPEQAVEWAKRRDARKLLSCLELLYQQGELSREELSAASAEVVRSFEKN